MPIDNFGREIPNLNPSDLLGNTKTTQQNKTTTDNKDLAGLLSSMSEKFDSSVRKVEEIFGKLMSYMKNTEKQDKKLDKMMSFQERMYKLTTTEFNRSGGAEGAKRMNELVKHGLKKGSIYVADIMTHKLLRDIKSLIQVQVSGRGAAKEHKLMSPKAYARMYGPYVGAEKAEAEKTSKEKEEKGGFLESFFKAEAYKKVEGVLKSFEDTILNVSINKPISESFDFKKMIKDENEFAIGIKRAVFQTQGLTAESGELLNAYTKIQKVAETTGFDRVSYQAQYIKSVKAGIRSQKTAEKITQSQLNAERQLGLAAGDLGDTFIDFVNQAGLGVNQVSAIGRGMTEVAKQTGLTGEYMKKALDASKPYVTNLRNAGQLTAMSAKNVTQLTASFQKFGVAGDDILKYLTSGTALIMDGSDKTAGFLLQSAARAGVVEELMTGAITKSEQGMKALGQGFDSMLKDTLGIDENFDKLPDKMKQIINLRAKALTGREAGELIQMGKAIKEAGKTFEDKMKDLAVERQKINKMTMDEKKAFEEKERALKAGKALDVLTAVSEASKGAKNLGEAMAQFGEGRSKFAKDLNILAGGKLGEEFKGTNQEAIRTALSSAITEVNKGLKIVDKKDSLIQSNRIEEALKDNSGAKLDQLIEDINKSNKVLTTAQIEATDPVTKAQNNLLKVNEEARDYLQQIRNFLSGIPGIATALTALGGLGIVMQGLSGAFSMFSNFKGLFKGFGNFFGKGGTPAIPPVKPPAGGGGGGLLGRAGRFLGGAGRIAGKALGPLGLLASGIGGFMETGTAAGGIFGALTGGAGTGSFLSPMLGVEKGGTADKALGVLGSAGYGAATGAAIGSIIPGVGTAIGAGVGAVIGGLTEGIKIGVGNMSFNQVVDAMASGVGGMWNTIYSNVLGPIGNTVSGVLSGIGSVASNVVSGLGDVASNIGKIGTSLASSAWEGTKSVVSTVGSAASSVGSAIASGASTAWSYVNPLNWFEEGTRKITQTGLGILHEGEMVIPQNILESMKAVGNGAFNTTGIGGMVKNMTGSNILGDVASRATGMLSAMTGPIGSMIGTVAQAGMRQIGMVPSSPANQLMATNTAMQAQISNAFADKKAEGTQTVEEKNSSDMLKALNTIIDLLGKAPVAAPAGGAVKLAARGVFGDSGLGSVMGGDYAKNDTIKAL